MTTAQKLLFGFGIGAAAGFGAHLTARSHERAMSGSDIPFKKGRGPLKKGRGPLLKVGRWGPKYRDPFKKIKRIVRMCYGLRGVSRNTTWTCIKQALPEWREYEDMIEWELRVLESRHGK
jgi:hypothetical protein